MTLDSVVSMPLVESGLGGGGDPSLGAAPSRSLGRQALVDTLARPGARLGLVWIAILLVFAIFAPFIANSMPLAVRIDGRWSSPLLHSLHAADVSVLTAAVCAAVVFLLVRAGRMTFAAAALVVLFVVAITIPLTLWPQVVDQYVHGELTRWRIIGWSFAGGLDLIAIAFLARGLGRRLAAGGRLLLLLALSPLLLLLVFPVRPPVTVVYDRYRSMAAEHRLQSVVWAPIPFSPDEHLRDERLAAPSSRHLLGTEGNGADILSWMIHGARIALSIGFVAAGISVTIGIIVGALMGYFAGTVDILGMRLIEIVEAVPTLILLLTVCAFFGRNLYMMMAIIGVVSWTSDARFIRAEFLRLRRQDFVQAALASGLPIRSIVFRHMLPNGITPVLVNSSFEIANAILYESTLSFLGLGLVDQPSWGQLLNQARYGGEGLVWWIATTPGLAIFLTVFSYNLIGEAVRDALDPKLRKQI